MGYDRSQLDRIFERTDGECHLCHRRLTRANYGLHGARGCWEVDHCVPRAHGGGDHGNNLRAACIACNRSRQTRPVRTVRSENGVTRAPLSRVAKVGKRRENAVALGGLGLLVGAVFNPVAAVVFAAVGASVGYDSDIQ
jgi:5-methylcytosine-specific restriction endonuclease McrA